MPLKKKLNSNHLLDDDSEVEEINEVKPRVCFNGLNMF